MFCRARKREVGRKILIAILTAKPNFRHYFGVPDDADVESLSSYQKVHEQADRIQVYTMFLVKMTSKLASQKKEEIP